MDISPIIFGSFAFVIHPAINHEFTSLPQDNFNQEELWGNHGITKTHTGKMLGGSGSHNDNLYNRGSPQNYNNFAKFVQDESWKYENILEHFITFENFRDKLANESERSEYYSTTGELRVQTDWPLFIRGWFKSAVELGFQAGDPNGYQRESFTPMVRSTWNGHRVSTYSTFVKPQGIQFNLTVLRCSVAEQILINDSEVAYGVLYKRLAIPQIAHASKEVIISCGTFSSPMLLIKSGIGPRTVLQEAKITIKSAVEGVGQNFRDYIGLSFPFQAKNPDPLYFSQTFESQVEQELNNFGANAENRTGLFTLKDTTQALSTHLELNQMGKKVGLICNFYFSLSQLSTRI